MSDTRPAIEQLRRALEAGYIDQATFDAALAAFNSPSTPSAGATAQGDHAQALSDSVQVEGDNHGLINLGLLIQQAQRPDASADDLGRAYLARILQQADHLPLYAGDTSNAQIRLSAVYTALLTQSAEHSPQDRLVNSEMELRNHSALDLLNAQPRLVLLGGPGSGKSTFVNYVALALAGEALGVRPNLADLIAPIPGNDGEEGAPQTWDHGPLLPVRVVLRDLIAHLPPEGREADADTVWRYLQAHLDKIALVPYADSLRQALAQGRALVLLDGLDEVPEAGKRRVQIKQAVERFAASFSASRYLITSRTYAYQQQDWKLRGFHEAHLQGFSLGQIHRFSEAWYGQMVSLDRLSEAAAQARIQTLKHAVETNPRIRELAGRPLLLTLIAQVQTERGGALPERREELYDKAVEMLLTQWEGMKTLTQPDGRVEKQPSLVEWLKAGRAELRTALDRLAFEAHRDQPRDENNPAATADIPSDKLLATLLRASAEPETVNGILLETYLRDRAGLLAAHGEGLYQFPHRSFQEYLAACHLTNDDFPDKLSNLGRSDPDRWREVVLLAGAKAARGAGTNAWLLAETLCPKAHYPQAVLHEHWGALLAGRVLAENIKPDQAAERDRDKLTRIRDWQLALLRGSALPAPERALAGRTLAFLGDPRPEVMTLAGMEFCLVPAGPFVMGGEEYLREKPQHPVNLALPYYLARYPVSVAQWRAFCSQRGEPPEASQEGRDNDPVTGVSFHDALAFCEHLTRAWRAGLPEGWVVTLPSEAQWEKAARGGDRIPVQPQPVAFQQVLEHHQGKLVEKKNPQPKREYPWGNSFDPDQANAENDIGEVSALGAYVGGGGPYGCEEMGGNVWEWTRSLWGKDWQQPDFNYPYDPDDVGRENIAADGEIWRVVRGGAWCDPRGLAHCTFRLRSLPDLRYYVLGFRVVLCSSPVGRR